MYSYYDNWTHYWIYRRSSRSTYYIGRVVGIGFGRRVGMAMVTADEPADNIVGLFPS
jgi:hypothetical protein